MKVEDGEPVEADAVFARDEDLVGFEDPGSESRLWVAIKAEAPQNLLGDFKAVAAGATGGGGGSEMFLCSHFWNKMVIGNEN